MSIKDIVRDPIAIGWSVIPIPKGSKAATGQWNKKTGGTRHTVNTRFAFFERILIHTRTDRPLRADDSDTFCFADLERRPCAGFNHTDHGHAQFPCGNEESIGLRKSR